MINEYPSCDDFQSELAYGDAAPRIALGRSTAVLRYHVIGSRRCTIVTTVSQCGTSQLNGASGSEQSEVGVDSVSEHQFSTAIAPPNEFMKVPTVSGGSHEYGKRGARLWAWQDRQTEAGVGCRYGNHVWFVRRALPTPRVLIEPITPRDYVHPVRCEAERQRANLGGDVTLLNINTVGVVHAHRMHPNASRPPHVPSIGNPVLCA